MKRAAFFYTNIFLYADDCGNAAKRERAIELVARYRRNGLAMISLQVMQAIELHRLSRISFWHAMIVHAAKAGGAEILFSEDLLDGGRFGGGRVESPFRLP